MDVPARLKWRKEEGRFAAYPTATEHKARFAEVRLYNTGYDSTTSPPRPVEYWAWLVRWDGWFVEHGFAHSKQAAADSATEAWWRNIETELPRDESLEAAMIVARALVRPPPNSLFNEDAEYLQKVAWHLRQVHGAEIRAGVPIVKNLDEQLAAEIARRREMGEFVEPAKGQAASGARRRRRR